jgi:hypothetical protein
MVDDYISVSRMEIKGEGGNQDSPLLPDGQIRRHRKPEKGRFFQRWEAFYVKRFSFFSVKILR